MAERVEGLIYANFAVRTGTRGEVLRMIAERTTKVDGHIYYPGDEIPDFGSLVCVDHDGNVRNYEGKYEDRLKLPKYDDLATGSSAFLSDNGNFVLCKYYADTKTWEGNGEVT